MNKYLNDKLAMEERQGNIISKLTFWLSQRQFYNLRILEQSKLTTTRFLHFLEIEEEYQS